MLSTGPHLLLAGERRYGSSYWEKLCASQRICLQVTTLSRLVFHLVLTFLILAFRNLYTIAHFLCPLSPACTLLLHLRNWVRCTSSKTTHILATFNKEVPKKRKNVFE